MAKSEKKYRKSRRGLLYAMLATLLVIASVVCACTVFFRVESVEAEGNVRYSTEQILAAASVEEGTNLILAPSEQIKQRMYENLPYLDVVEVQKRPPTTLRLVITEAQPVAVVSTGEETRWIIDSKGKLLEQPDETLALEYINVEGVTFRPGEQGELLTAATENEGQLKGLLGLLQALQKRGIIDKISDINISSRTEISMIYENRLRVEMLNNANFDRKILILTQTVALLQEWEWGTIHMKTETVYMTKD